MSTKKIVRNRRLCCNGIYFEGCTARQSPEVVLEQRKPRAISQANDIW